MDELRAHQHVLTPGRYVGTEDSDSEEESFESSFERLSLSLRTQFSRASMLHEQIVKNLERLR